MALLGNFRPGTGWSWVTPVLSQGLSIVGFVFIAVAIGLVIWGFVRAPTVEKYKTTENPISVIKADLIKLNNYERNVAVEKSQEKVLSLTTKE